MQTLYVYFLPPTSWQEGVRDPRSSAPPPPPSAPHRRPHNDIAKESVEILGLARRGNNGASVGTRSELPDTPSSMTSTRRGYADASPAISNVPSLASTDARDAAQVRDRILRGENPAGGPLLGELHEKDEWEFPHKKTKPKTGLKDALHVLGAERRRLTNSEVGRANEFEESEASTSLDRAAVNFSTERKHKHDPVKLARRMDLRAGPEEESVGVRGSAGK